MENIGFMLLTLLWNIVLFAMIIAVVWWVTKKVLALPILKPFEPYAIAFLAILVAALVIMFITGEAGWWGEWGVGYHTRFLPHAR